MLNKGKLVKDNPQKQKLHGYKLRRELWTITQKYWVVSVNKLLG